MRILYYNCSAGISGDMNLAALIDLGADERYLVGELQKLGIDGWRFSTVKDQRNGIWGTRAIVECAGGTLDNGGHCRLGNTDAPNARGFGESGSGDSCGAVAENGACQPEACTGELHHKHCGADDPQALSRSFRGASAEEILEHLFDANKKPSESGEAGKKHASGQSANSQCCRDLESQHRDGDHHGRDHAEHHGHCHSGHSSHSHGRSFADIEALIGGSGLSENVKSIALSVFGALAQAEAQIHNKDVSEVHFHEVGAVDSIIDIVGSAICLEYLGVEQIFVGQIEMGSGTVACAHGCMPVPAPATSVLARGFDCCMGGVDGEATTPTGMAYLAALARTGKVDGRVVARGIGIGQRNCRQRPNVLQVCLLESGDYSELQTDNNKGGQRLFELASNIDDMTSETLSYLCQKLFEAGALDVWQTPIVMKRGRLATKISALVKEKDVESVYGAFFDNSSTLGVRQYEVGRRALGRRVFKFESSLGSVGIKESESGNFKIEFSDLQRIAAEHKIPIMKARLKIETEFESSRI